MNMCKEKKKKTNKIFNIVVNVDLVQLSFVMNDRSEENERNDSGTFNTPYTHTCELKSSVNSIIIVDCIQIVNRPNMTQHSEC